MEGLASKEGENYTYKYSRTYLELNCQWLFEILKLTLSIMCIITVTLSSIISLEETHSVNGKPITKGNSLYSATAYYEYTVTLIILMMSFCIPLFYFTRADIFLGTGPWQKVLLIYNLVMFICVVPALVLITIILYRVHNHDNIKAPRLSNNSGARTYIYEEIRRFNGEIDNLGNGLTSRNSMGQFYVDNKYLTGCLWANLAGLMALLVVFTGHLLAIPYKRNRTEEEEHRYRFDRYIYKVSGDTSASSTLSDSTYRTGRTGTTRLASSRAAGYETGYTGFTTGYTTGKSGNASLYSEGLNERRASTARNNRGRMRKDKILKAERQQQQTGKGFDTSPMTNSRYQTTNASSVTEFGVKSKPSLGEKIKSKASKDKEPQRYSMQSNSKLDNTNLTKDENSTTNDDDSAATIASGSVSGQYV